jgi:hypothetical protein
MKAAFFSIVRKLRSADYDVLSAAESFPSASDQQVLNMLSKKGEYSLQRIKISENGCLRMGKR